MGTNMRQLSIFAKTTTSLPIAKTNITGDSTSSSLLYLTNIPFVRFSMMNVAVMGFGDGSVAFPRAVYISSLLGATFGPGVQFGPNNVGYLTSGALAVNSVPSLHIVNSIFIGNSAVVQADNNNLYASGGALSIFSSNNIVISNSTFINISISGGYGSGGALFFQNANNVNISDCSIVDNSITGGGGQGGALAFWSSNTITVSSCSIKGNSLTGGGGVGAGAFP